MDSPTGFAHIMDVPNPFPRNGPEHTESAIERLDIMIPPGSLESFQGESSVSLLAVCQAAWSLVLGVLQDASDVCFGNVVSGRTAAIENIDRLVAPCFNTLPVRVNTATFHSYQDLVKHLHRLNTNALPHELVALRQLQQKHSAGRSLR